MMEKPRLSICIPTYNRAAYLEKCLEAIVTQEGFDHRVEVVISDNCSTDNTQAVGMKYQTEYKNIHYFRNSENLRDANFPLSLRRASGALRKLTNDTLVYKPGAVAYMLQAVEEQMDARPRPQLYFLSSGKLDTDKKKLSTLEDYIGTVNFNLTWIRSLAIWEEDCEDLDMMTEKADTRLAQVPFLIENFQKHRGAVICDRPVMASADPPKKDLSYGIYHVFYETFLGLLQGYVDSGAISGECYEGVRKELLMKFFTEWIVLWELDRNQFVFSEENLRGLVEEAYRNEPYFREYKKRLMLCRTKARVRKILRKVKRALR